MPALYSTWKMRYPHLVLVKFTWSGIWEAIPKYMCWSIWLARNDNIFNNVQQQPLKVVAKAKAFLIETAGVHSFKKGHSFLPDEKKWMVTYTFRDRNKVPVRPSITPKWRRRDSEADFQIWCRTQGKASIFFDGASKGNLGREGAGEVIYSADGKSVDSFSWGLGHKTINHTEILALLKAF